MSNWISVAPTTVRNDYHAKQMLILGGIDTYRPEFLLWTALENRDRILKNRNCPALSSRLRESEAGDQLGGGGHQGLDEVPALFSGG